MVGLINGPHNAPGWDSGTVLELFSPAAETANKKMLVLCAVRHSWGSDSVILVRDLKQWPSAHPHLALSSDWQSDDCILRSSDAVMSDNAGSDGQGYEDLTENSYRLGSKSAFSSLLHSSRCSVERFTTSHNVMCESMWLFMFGVALMWSLQSKLWNLHYITLHVI